jgi:hypothetical protein
MELFRRRPSRGTCSESWQRCLPLSFCSIRHRISSRAWRGARGCEHRRSGARGSRGGSAQPTRDRPQTRGLASMRPRRPFLLILCYRALRWKTSISGIPRSSSRETTAGQSRVRVDNSPNSRAGAFLDWCPAQRIGIGYIQRGTPRDVRGCLESCGFRAIVSSQIGPS